MRAKFQLDTRKTKRRKKTSSHCLLSGEHVNSVSADQQKEPERRDSSLFQTPQTSKKRQAVEHTMVSTPSTPIPSVKRHISTPGSLLHAMSGTGSRCSAEATPMKSWFGRSLQDSFLPKEEQRRNEIMVVCMQHILGTEKKLIENVTHFLNDANENVLLKGKLYSTHTQTMRNMKVYVSDISPPERYGEFSVKLVEGIQKMLYEVKEKVNQQTIFKIIIPDDGAHVIRAIAADETFLRDLKKRNIYLYGVEQTKKGHRYLEEHPPGFPWISVSTSRIKRTIESDFIANTIFVFFCIVCSL